MMLAPILLFVYNRPAHAKRAIEALYFGCRKRAVYLLGCSP